MNSHIEQSSAPRKMSGEDQMMFQDHVPFVDKVSKKRVAFDRREKKNPKLSSGYTIEDSLMTVYAATCLCATSH